MGSSAVACTLNLFLLTAIPAVLAVTFKVGDASGWNIGIDYTTWVREKTFRVGDTLEFQYGPNHAVSVVDRAGFDSCNGSGAMQSFSNRDTKIDLTTVGTMHFLCPVPGHCLYGMKLIVPVLAAASTPATPSPSSRKLKTLTPSASPSDSKSSTPSSSYPLVPSPSPSTATSKGVMSYGVIGMTIVLMHGLMS